MGSSQIRVLEEDDTANIGPVQLFRRAPFVSLPSNKTPTETTVCCVEQIFLLQMAAQLHNTNVFEKALVTAESQQLNNITDYQSLSVVYV